MSKNRNKKWNLLHSDLDNEKVENLSFELGCSRVLATLLFERGYEDKKSALAFIKKSQEILHDPFLLNDMDIAVKRIISAVKNNEKITVYGDYDVDGVTSVCNLYLYLKNIGADVDYYIPSRKGEGYGVSTEAIDKLKTRGTNLIITVDTGVTAISETEYAKKLGIDVLITDHHECTDNLPDAIAVINPKRHDTRYPFQALAGVGVIFKLLCALESEYQKIDIISATRNIAYDYSDLTAIGTIADVMPVIDENRIIVALGLLQAEKTKKIGLSALIDLCRNGEGKAPKYKQQKKKLSSGFVGFTLAPRINAAGRIGSANDAVELFLASNLQKAQELALALCEINKERQLTENMIADRVYSYIESNSYDNKSMLILDDIDWHHGVIGIVASRVSDRYGVPSILISFEGNDDPYSPEAIGKGSGRSVGGMNLVEALSSCSDLLEKFGGHELAAGLSIKRKNLDIFKARMEEYAKSCFAGAEPEHVLDIDCELEAQDITLDLANEISSLEPYGVSNPNPVFVLRNAILNDIIPVGMNRHLKLNLSKDNKQFSAMLFSTAPEEFLFTQGDEIDIAFNLETNEFNGISSVQMSLKDIKLSERFLDLERVNEQLYQSVKLGECNLDSSYIIPEREDFETVYKFLLSSARFGKSSYRISKLLSDMVKRKCSDNLNYVKLKFIIKVFRELNIISIEEIDNLSFSYHFTYGKGKTCLDKSNILKKLKSIYTKK